MLRWASRARSVDAVAAELAKVWSSHRAHGAGAGRGAGATRRGPVERDEPRRHRRPRGGRRARRLDRRRAGRAAPFAHAAGRARRSRRAAVARRPGAGALRAAVGDRARDVLRARLPDVRRRERPAHGRTGDAAPHPRPAGHGLVAERAAIRVSGASTELLSLADRILVDGSGWSGDGLARLGDDDHAVRPSRHRDRRLRAPPPGALARGHRLDLRSARAPAVSSATSTASRSTTRPRRHAGVGATSSGRCTTWRGSRRGSGMTVVTPVRAGTEAWSGYEAMLRHGRRRVAGPPPAGRVAPAPPGTTLVGRAARDARPLPAVGRGHRVRGGRGRPRVRSTPMRCPSAGSSRLAGARPTCSPRRSTRPAGTS